MKSIKIGNRFKIYDDSIKTYDQLPAQTYAVRFEQFTGFYLEEHSDLNINEKIYGAHEVKVKKVIRSFKAFARNLGVILSGNKGIGKSLFARLLCRNAMAEGFPVIIIDQFIPGIAAFIESIEQEVVVLFDEFDKTFGGIHVGENEANPQAALLSLFDGVANGKKLYVVTCNELRGLNDYLVNRPGRFHYHFRFEYPSDQEIREYLTDQLAPFYYSEIEKVVAFSKRVCLNYDCLRAIAFELNTGDAFETAIQDLNILNLSEEKYRITLHFKDGATLVNRKCYLDLFDNDDEIEVELYDNRNSNICDVSFSTEDAEYNPAKGVMTVDGKCCKIVYWSKNCPEELKKAEIGYLSIAHTYDRNLHYTLAY